MPKLKPQILSYTFALGLCVSPLAQTNVPVDSSDLPWDFQLDQLERQVGVGEHASVLDQARELVEDVESEFGLFHKYLVDPLLLMGDAYLGLDQPDEALRVYERALQIERTVSGPHSIVQQPIVRKVGVAQQRRGDYQRATLMFEKAYELSLQHHGADNPALIPDSIRLLDWYQDHDQHFHSAILSKEVLRLASRVWYPHDERILELKRAFAKAMLSVSFPPQVEFGTPRFRARVPGFDYADFRRMPAAFFHMGSEALGEVVDVLKTNDSTDPILYISTLIELADFYQAARITSRSFPLYRQAWNALSDTPRLRERIFSEPKLLYIGLPTLPNPDEVDFAVGHIELELTITDSGRVVGRRTIDVKPRNDPLEHRVRIAARSARYRPAFVDSEPVWKRNVVLDHYYPLGRR